MNGTSTVLMLFFALVGIAFAISTGYWWGRIRGYDDGHKEGYREGAFDKEYFS